MKIIDEEEKNAHKSYVLTEGIKGLFYGGVVSVGIYTYLKTRHPVRFSRFTPSIKTAILTMPTVSLLAFMADEGSVEFDRQMYSQGHTNQRVLEEYKAWKNMPFQDKVVSALGTHKYKIILTAWMASLYGSWLFVNRDKVMTAPQKLVQARMYAQAITIVLLLSTIVLAVKEEELNKRKPAPVPEWKRVLMEKEEAQNVTAHLADYHEKKAKLEAKEKGQ